MSIKKIIEKYIKKKDYFQNDFMTKLSIKIMHKNIFIKKGNFIQKTIFMDKGKIEIDDKFSIGYKIGGGFKGAFSEIQTREKQAIIKIGRNFCTNNGIFLCANKKIEIGDDVLIGKNVTIMDHNGHGISPEFRRNYGGTAKEIIIENNVWIGSGAYILPGTKIGYNSIVGAGAIVKGEYPPNCIIQGNPAQIVRYIVEER